jgi:hypothetical protein
MEGTGIPRRKDSTSRGLLLGCPSIETLKLRVDI